MEGDHGIKLLEKLFQILKDEGVLQPKFSDPVIHFKDPEKLLDDFEFTIDNQGHATPAAIEQICRDVMKYSTKTNHVKFHTFLYGGYDFYGLCASWIIDALNTIPMTYDVAPVFSLMEDVVIKKLLNLYGINDGDGIFTPGGSMATLYAMTLARFKKYPESKKTGIFNQKPLVCFTSKEAHFCIDKGANWLGIGEENVIVIETNEKGEMILKDLEEEVIKSISEGKVPFFVQATCGTTVLGAYDDLRGLAMICQKYGMWLHADGCYGGQVIFSKKYKYLMIGSELADSISYCPQKMGGAPLQCAVFLTKYKGLLLECNKTGAGYVFATEKYYSTCYDTGDKSVQCGKKVDAFKLWLILKARGLDAFEEITVNIFESAKYLSDLIKSRDGFRLVVDNQASPSICFWYIPKNLRGTTENPEFWSKIDKITTIISSTLVKSGRQMIGYSKLPKKHSANFFRVALVGYPRPSKESMDSIVNEIESVGDKL
uniref:CSON003636 protein n=1 Tax=Culicoides sonorensis TaxID=179676 RepID=A0A336MMD0_CULSO